MPVVEDILIRIVGLILKVLHPFFAKQNESSQNPGEIVGPRMLILAYSKELRCRSSD